MIATLDKCVECGGCGGGGCSEFYAPKKHNFSSRSRTDLKGISAVDLAQIHGAHGEVAVQT